MGRSTKKGPFVDAHLMVKIETLNKANDKKVVKHLVAALDDSFPRCGPHHRRAQRQEICAGVRDREHGGAQAGRVCTHAQFKGHSMKAADRDGGEAEVGKSAKPAPARTVRKAETAK
jgi:small subunit ribosomal protein S19